MPDIYWLIAAQRRFLEAMDTTLSPPALGQIYETVCGMLAATFPEAAALLVRDRLRGYSRKSNRHILLVEVTWRSRALEPLPKGRPDSGPAPTQGQQFRIGWPGFCEAELGQPTLTTAHVVKIADDPQVLAQELAAWESCRPVGMTHDSILMRLRPGPRDVTQLREEFPHVLEIEEELALAYLELEQTRDAEAERLYRQAVADCPRAAVQTMRRQAELIAACAIPEVRSSWTPAKFDDVFGPLGP